MIPSDVFTPTRDGGEAEAASAESSLWYGCKNKYGTEGRANARHRLGEDAGERHEPEAGHAVADAPRQPFVTLPTWVRW